MAMALIYPDMQRQQSLIEIPVPCWYILHHHGIYHKQMLTALVVDEHGNIVELEGYAAAGMSGNDFFLLTKSDTWRMPHGSELMLLPDRAPIVFDLFIDRFETLETNPFQPDQRIYPVGVFNSPGM